MDLLYWLAYRVSEVLGGLTILTGLQGVWSFRWTHHIDWPTGCLEFQADSPNWLAYRVSEVLGGLTTLTGLQGVWGFRHTHQTDWPVFPGWHIHITTGLHCGLCTHCWSPPLVPVFQLGHWRLTTGSPALACGGCLNFFIMGHKCNLLQQTCNNSVTFTNASKYRQEQLIPNTVLPPPPCDHNLCRTFEVPGKG